MLLIQPLHTCVDDGICELEFQINSTPPPGKGETKIRPDFLMDCPIIPFVVWRIGKRNRSQGIRDHPRTTELDSHRDTASPSAIVLTPATPPPR